MFLCFVVVVYGKFCIYTTCYRDGEAKELERQLQEMRETVTQLQLERTELHTKVTAMAPCMHHTTVEKFLCVTSPMYKLPLILTQQ